MGDFCGVLVVVDGLVDVVDVVDAGFRVGSVLAVEAFVNSIGSATGGDCKVGASIA